eukprot:scaffold330579_cov63-Tisochrysis_lutea.AAC.1
MQPNMATGTRHDKVYPMTATGPPRMAASGTVKRTHAPAPEAKNEREMAMVPCVLRAVTYVSVRFFRSPV